MAEEKQGGWFQDSNEETNEPQNNEETQEQEEKPKKAVKETKEKKSNKKTGSILREGDDLLDNGSEIEPENESEDGLVIEDVEVKNNKQEPKIRPMTISLIIIVVILLALLVIMILRNIYGIITFF
jgi:cobalamin biosynthesis Mg chelatase CobN